MKINLIVIRTNQPNELAKLYSQIGIEFDYHKHGKGSWHYSAEIEKLVFEIYPLMKNQKIADKSLRLGFDVERLDELIEKLRANKIEIIAEPKKSEYGYFAVIKDLDGRKIELKDKPAGNKVENDNVS
jgi:lactoylglutathione lyase